MSKLFDFLSRLVEKVNQIKPDWSINDESSPAYISGRTHYDGRVKTCVVDQKTFDIDDVLEYDYSWYNESPFPALCTPGTYEIVWNGTPYTVSAQYNDDEEVIAYGDINRETTPFYIELSFSYDYDNTSLVSTRIVVDYTGKTQTITMSVNEVTGEYVKLPEVYIPENIMRKNDWVQSDYFQNDSTQPDYIKHKIGSTYLKKENVVKFDVTINRDESGNLTTTYVDFPQSGMNEFVDYTAYVSYGDGDEDGYYDLGWEEGHIYGTDDFSVTEEYISEGDSEKHVLCIECSRQYSGEVYIRLYAYEDVEKIVTVTQDAIPDTIARVSDLPITEQEIDVLTSLVN